MRVGSLSSNDHLLILRSEYRGRTPIWRTAKTNLAFSQAPPARSRGPPVAGRFKSKSLSHQGAVGDPIIEWRMK